MAACSHQCRTCRADAQDLTSPCLMQLDSSLVYRLRSWELLIRMNICLHMIYTLGKMLFIKMLLVSCDIHPLLPACVCCPEVTILLQGKVSPTGRHKLTWNHTNHRTRSQKMNIPVYNLVICGHWKLTASSLIIKIIKYNLILDERGTLSPQSNFICKVLSDYLTINWIFLAWSGLHKSSYPIECKMPMV